MIIKAILTKINGETIGIFVPKSRKELDKYKSDMRELFKKGLCTKDEFNEVNKQRLNPYTIYDNREDIYFEYQSYVNGVMIDVEIKIFNIEKELKK